MISQLTIQPVVGDSSKPVILSRMLETNGNLFHVIVTSLLMGMT